MRLQWDLELTNPEYKAMHLYFQSEIIIVMNDVLEVDNFHMVDCAVIYNLPSVIIQFTRGRVLVCVITLPRQSSVSAAHLTPPASHPRWLSLQWGTDPASGHYTYPYYHQPNTGVCRLHNTFTFNIQQSSWLGGLVMAGMKTNLFSVK